MRIGIGLSRVSDSARAAIEAVRKAKQGAPKPQLAIVYASIHHDQSKIYAAITSELDAATVLGGSSYAEITGVSVTRRG